MHASTRCLVIALFVAVVGSTGCNKTPVPESKRDWVGWWIAGNGSSLEIREDGTCSYN
ncbi:MAG: hypothetical protein ABEK29_02680 [Bradymonadaceae bacterium]